MKEKEEKAPEMVEKEMAEKEEKDNSPKQEMAEKEEKDNSPKQEMAEKDMQLEAKEVMRKEGIKVVYKVGETWFKRETDAKNCAKKRKGKVEKYEA
ncbi:MAG: hypothetical protein MJZ71_05545 [Bacteroidales bacterium]|nr:hypothetical protein [Bacteroidales bacterium]